MELESASRHRPQFDSRAVEIDRFKNVFSIPGIELTSYEGTHLLVYFYDIKSLLRFYSRDVQPFIGPEIMSSLSLELETSSSAPADSKR